MVQIFFQVYLSWIMMPFGRCKLHTRNAELTIMPKRLCQRVSAKWQTLYQRIYLRNRLGRMKSKSHRQMFFFFLLLLLLFLLLFFQEVWRVTFMLPCTSMTRGWRLHCVSYTKLWIHVVQTLSNSGYNCIFFYQKILQNTLIFFFATQLII